MIYRHLGGDAYEVTLIVYRDCNPSAAGFDDPALIQFFGVSPGSSVVESLLSVEIPLYSNVINVPIVLGNPCGIPPDGLCIEEATYTTEVNLPPSSYGWDVFWSQCCRTPSSVNIDFNIGEGAVYAAHIPGTSVAANAFENSSPTFTLKPPAVVCSNLEFFWDHSAVDLDGDSLSYELCTPYIEFIGSSYSPGTDPYLPVIYTGGFSSEYPITSEPPIAIDPVTGAITGTPTMPGQYAFAVCVSEYRDGMLIGSHQREFQFNVTMCDPNIVADIEAQTPDQICTGETLTLGNNSINGTFYEWDFGVDTSFTDVSDVFEPTFTWPGPGEYEVTLVVNPGWPCADTTQSSFLITDSLVTDAFLTSVEGSPTATYPYSTIVGIADTVFYDNGDVFPLQAWLDAEPDGTFLWENQEIDALAIEGCNDVTLHFTRAEEDALETDTVLLTLSGSTEEGLDHAVLSEPIVFEMGVTDLTLDMEIVADTLDEGVEMVTITQELYDCGDTLTSTYHVVVLDPVPFSAQVLPLECASGDGIQIVAVEDIVGFGPFDASWSVDGQTLDEGGSLMQETADTAQIAMIDDAGNWIPNQDVHITLTDHCGNPWQHAIELRSLVVHPEEFCVDSAFDFPAYNADLPVLDVLANGISLLEGETLIDTLTLEAVEVGGLWSLQSLVTGAYDWTGELTVIDSCGRASSAQVYILEYVCTEGCTNEAACNFDVDAGLDDGSCAFPGDDCDDGDEDTEGEVLTDECDCVWQNSADGMVSNSLNVAVMPNPSSGWVRVVGNAGSSQIRVLSMDGRLLHEQTHDNLNQGARLSLPLPNGLYLLEVNQRNVRFLSRLMIRR